LGTDAALKCQYLFSELKAWCLCKESFIRTKPLFQ